MWLRNNRSYADQLKRFSPGELKGALRFVAHMAIADANGAQCVECTRRSLNLCSVTESDRIAHWCSLVIVEANAGPGSCCERILILEQLSHEAINKLVLLGDESEVVRDVPPSLERIGLVQYHEPSWRLSDLGQWFVAPLDLPS